MKKSDDGKYFVWNKGEVEALSSHFSTKEFACKCINDDCVEQRAAVALIEKLQALRISFQLPISVTSGFRCAKHQNALRDGGLQTTTGQSTHELGHAADIKPKLADRGTIKRLSELAANHFKAIGTAASFVHVDIRADKKRRWKYD